MLVWNKPIGVILWGGGGGGAGGELIFGRVQYIIFQMDWKRYVFTLVKYLQSLLRPEVYMYLEMSDYYGAIRPPSCYLSLPL